MLFVLPSFPLHSQPSFLCEHHTSWAFRYLSDPWCRKKVKSDRLHSGHGLLCSFIRSIHSRQNSFPQGQLMTQGSLGICRQTGHSVWIASGGGVTNSQSNPPKYGGPLVQFSSVTRPSLVAGRPSPVTRHPSLVTRLTSPARRLSLIIGLGVGVAY